ncbi:hypothetical protein AWI43_01740 [Streptomyces sp. WAC04657]|nr:hypothetical protein AWI43_01740 [Streptomyces sp. WAC04657]
MRVPRTRRHSAGTALISTVRTTAATTPCHGSGKSEPPRMPISWYVAAHARQAAASPRTKRRSGTSASRHASITGIRPAGTSRDRTSTDTWCASSRSRACASRSGEARPSSAASHREPLSECTPRRPSQYSAVSPRSAANADTRKTKSSDSGEVWWKATTAAELTIAPVGTTGTSAPSATSRNSEG